MVEVMNLTIQDYEDKKSQNGKRYTRFKTEKGWMSAFESNVIDELKKLEGKKVKVGVAIDKEKGFQNIRSFEGEADEEDNPGNEEFPVERPGEQAQPKDKPSQETMWASYAKDLIIAGKETDEAIKIVKQLRKEFE